ncbi:MAG: SEL1-like repeat protein [Candidatus Thiodiazotropha sp. (ex Monitilora ramsayi)]|nr:SEL1-like repeat protein [Candidatus Thiodiazotropha sp. (ex Monitilora ramsayi)]
MFHRNTRRNLIIMSSLLLFTLLSIGCTSAPKSEIAEDPDAILQQAHKAYANEDYQQVFQLVFPLAAAGNDQAQYTLGYLYFHGLGIEKNERQAMNWIQRAAAQGNKKALHALK